MRRKTIERLKKKLSNFQVDPNFKKSWEKKRDFLAETRKLKEALGKRGLKEKDILKDFDEFYHRK